MSAVDLWPRQKDEIVEAVTAHMKQGGSTHIGHFVAEYKDVAYTVIQAREPIQPPGGIPDFRWHLSVAGPEGVPPWDAMAAIAHAVRPGVAFCIPVPPRSQWMNYNERVLHLYEVKDHNLTEQWRFEGRGHTPT